MQQTAIINVVGLSSELLQQNMPFLSKWAADNRKFRLLIQFYQQLLVPLNRPI